MVSPSLQTAALSRVLVGEGGMRGLLSAVPTSPSPFCQSHTFLTPTFSQTFSHVFFLSHTCISSHNSVPFLSLTIPTPPHTSCDCPANKTKLVPVALEASATPTSYLARLTCLTSPSTWISHLRTFFLHQPFPMTRVVFPHGSCLAPSHALRLAVITDFPF